MVRYLKDPNALLDYTNDWSIWLGVDTIVTSSWELPTGLNQEAAAFTLKTATIWLSGGVDGEEYTITNRIATAAGRINDRSIRITCIPL